MPVPPDLSSPLTRFALGDLREEDRTALEGQLLSDDDRNEQFQMACDELIHAYLAGALPADDRARFETYFMNTPLRRQRVAFIRALLSAADERRRPIRRPWLLAVAAALTLVVVSAALAFLWSGRNVPPEKTATNDVPRPAVRPATTAAPLVPAVTIVPLPSAGTGDVEVAIAEGTRTVRLELPVSEDGPPSYSAAVARAIDRNVVWRASSLVPRAVGAPLVIEVPAALLAAADYLLIVRGEVLRDPEESRPLPPREITLHIQRQRQSP